MEEKAVMAPLWVSKGLKDRIVRRAKTEGMSSAAWQRRALAAAAGYRFRHERKKGD